jgi:hypothetical protein
MHLFSMLEYTQVGNTGVDNSKYIKIMTNRMDQLMIGINYVYNNNHMDKYIRIYMRQIIRSYTHELLNLGHILI